MLSSFTAFGDELPSANGLKGGSVLFIKPCILLMSSAVIEKSRESFTTLLSSGAGSSAIRLSVRANGGTNLYIKSNSLL